MPSMVYGAAKNVGTGIQVACRPEHAECTKRFEELHSMHDLLMVVDDEALHRHTVFCMHVPATVDPDHQKVCRLCQL